MQGIYCIKNVNSGRKYYGSSQNVEKRLLQHRKDLIKDKHHNMQLQRCFNKYGDIFEYSLVEETYFSSLTELLKYEQTFIDSNIHGYNMAPALGGNILGVHPDKDKIRQRINESHKKAMSKMTAAERKNKFGKKGTDNPNWRDGGVSKKICPKCRINKIREKSNSCNVCRDRTAESNPFYGKTHSEQTKNVLREKMSGENSWILGIDPKELPYTKHYEISYPDGSKKVVAGLKAIAEEFMVSIPNIHGVINRCKNGNPPQRGKCAGYIIVEIPGPMAV